jgi:hypothetical protein
MPLLPAPLLSPHRLANHLSLGWAHVRHPCHGSSSGIRSSGIRPWHGRCVCSILYEIEHGPQARIQWIEQRRPSLPDGLPSSPCHRPSPPTAGIRSGGGSALLSDISGGGRRKTAVALDAAMTSPARGGRQSRGAAAEEQESTTTRPLELHFYCLDPGGGEGPLCQ